MPPIQGQIGGLYKAAFIIIQFWSLHREKILLVTGAISKDMHKPLVEQISPKICPVKSVASYNQEKICPIRQRKKSQCYHRA